MAKRSTVREKEMYGEFATAFRYCFACGWSEWSPFQFRDWCYPRLDNAHIVGGSGRRHDRRDIVRLCDGCHRLNHRETIRMMNGIALPWLTLGNMLAIKLEHDPEFYDVEYLKSLRIARAEPIEPEPLNPWFLEQRVRNRASKAFGWRGG